MNILENRNKFKHINNVYLISLLIHIIENPKTINICLMTFQKMHENMSC
jgi:hypothetical protein